MKVALLIVVLALAVSQSHAWFRGIGPWRWGGLGWGGIGPWGGLGWGGYGGLGYGGLGWGGIGPWGYGGFFGRGFFGGRGFGGRGFRGRRTVDDSIVPGPTVDRTLCSFTTKKNIISCHGPNHNFECSAVPVFTGLDANTYRIQNLTVVPEVFAVGDVETPVYRLFSAQVDGSGLNHYTVIEKNNHVKLSVYRGEQIKETGLRIQDETCWKSFQTLVTDVKPLTVGFSLFIDNTVVPTTTVA